MFYKEYNALEYFRMIIFSYPCQKDKWIFLWYLLQESVKIWYLLWGSKGKIHLTVSCPPPPSLGILGVFDSQTCGHWTPSNLSHAVQILLTQHCCPWGICWRELWFLVTTCLSPWFGGQRSALQSISTAYLRRVAAFSVFFSFLFIVTADF